MVTSRKWIWPSVGGTPVNQGLDSEMFDRDDYPYSETFVREAIQNSLDARLDDAKPVTIRFSFHEDKLRQREPFLKEAIDFRRKAGLSVPSDWEAGRINWLVVEDSNTKGLLGDLKDRTGDFWGYWLNFGLSNKTGTGRGGRGIGRVTFLIASQMHSVVGLTRRSSDLSLGACGMCVLKAGPYEGDFKSTHAYLAASENGSVYDLHEDDEFHDRLIKNFDLQSYEESSGLSLVIPYPHDELTEDGILAAAVDHFSPAILRGNLVVEVGVNTLDRTTIRELGPYLSKHITTRAIAQDVDRYLGMIEQGMKPNLPKVALPTEKTKLSSMREDALVTELRGKLGEDESVAFELAFPLSKAGQSEEVSLTVVAAPTPYQKSHIDRLSREGMSLPDVKSRRTSEIDLVALVENERLAQYLNFCEGKAHLDLLESKEVKAKLLENGFEGVSVRRLIKFLPDNLREILTEQSDEPDASVFEHFFGIPDPSGERKKVPGKKKKDDPPPPPPPPPEPSIPAVRVEALDDGFQVVANPAYTKFPARISIKMAYANGTNSLSWSPFDFKPKDLKVEHAGCEFEFAENKIEIEEFGAESSIAITGFDPRREIDTRVRAVSHAS